jgi:parallel beta-helix repeat protein
VKSDKFGKECRLISCPPKRSLALLNVANIWRTAGAAILLCSLARAAETPNNPPALPPQWIQRYVSPDGDDRWSGTLAAPSADHSDGPFATLERARDAIRTLNRSPRTDAGAVVYLRGGTYGRTQTFHLEPQDGGSADRAVVYRASPGEHVRLSGGRFVRNFAPVTDPAILARLEPAARGKVLRTNLPEQGITDFGELSSRGFHRPIQSAALELFFRGTAMPLAHWPKRGFATITATPAGADSGRFTFDDPHMARWANAPDIWIHGYWKRTWADSFEKIRLIDVEHHEIATEPPHGIYGYSPGGRFVVLNALEELGEPGEWYLDRRTGMLYFWPPGDIRDGDVVVSMLAGAMVEIRGASRVTLRDLTIECSRGAGAIVAGASHDRIAGCTFENLGTFAVSIGQPCQNPTDELYKDPMLDRNAGTDNGIVSCDIRHVGEGGILLGGGDRRTLAAGDNFAINNRIADYSRWVRTYRPAIFVDGVGNHVVQNFIADGPHVAILLKGNDHIIEYNEIARVCTETADAGAFYMGRDFTERGNVIRFNLFRDCGGPGAFSSDVSAIYLDDCASGTLVYGNIISKCGRGILLGGGRDNTIDNNLLIECNPAIHIDARGLAWMKNFFDGTEPILFDRLRLAHHDQPPYSRRYPQLARLLNDHPAVPRGNRISHNVRVGGKWLDLPGNQDEKIFEIRDNFITGDPQLIDPEHGDFRPAAESPVWKMGFKGIAAGKIGVQMDEYREVGR